jgi:hypothetical protein
MSQRRAFGTASRHHHRLHVERIRPNADKHTEAIIDTISRAKVFEEHPA